MCSQRERQRETGDDYIPGNKCGLSTAGMKMLSGVAVAYGLEDVSGSATPLNNMCMSASVSTYIQSLCAWTYASMHVCGKDPLALPFIDTNNIFFVATCIISRLVFFMVSGLFTLLGLLSLFLLTQVQY